MSVAARSTANRPLVTVVVPTRDEADDIAACLESIAAQDLALELIEVIVVDGSSSDETIERASAVLGECPFARAEVVVNEVGSTPSNLNVGLGLARGEYLCRVDARSHIPPDYVRRCVDVLASRREVAVVGGAQVAMVNGGRNGPGISRALNNPLGMGLSRYRSNRRSAATETVYLGFFRVDDLHRAGGWDERWEKNQDFELNRRMGRVAVVWYEENLPVGYVPRSSLSELAGQYHQYGRWKVRYWRRTGDRPRPRQVLLLAGSASAFAGGLLAMVPLARSPRRLATAGIVGLLAAFVFESRSTGPAGGARDRAVSVAASAAVAGGWLSGVISEWLRPAPVRRLGAVRTEP